MQWLLKDLYLVTEPLYDDIAAQLKNSEPHQRRIIHVFTQVDQLELFDPETGV